MGRGAHDPVNASRMQDMKKATLAHTGTLLLILLVGLVSYANSLHGSFHCDDSTSIVQNTGIKSLDTARVWEENTQRRSVEYCENVRDDLAKAREKGCRVERGIIESAERMCAGQAPK